MQHDFAVSHSVPELADHLVKVLRSLGARVVEDRRPPKPEAALGALLSAPVAVFLRYGYLAAVQRGGVSPRYRLLRWALEDAVEAATVYPFRGSANREPKAAIAICCVFGPAELASFRFPPGLGQRNRTRALDRLFSVLETCARSDDSLLLRARERLGTGGWRLDLRFDDRTGEWAIAGIEQERPASRELASA